MGVKDLIKKMEELATNGKGDSSSGAAPSEKKTAPAPAPVGAKPADAANEAAKRSFSDAKPEAASSAPAAPRENEETTATAPAAPKPADEAPEASKQPASEGNAEPASSAPAVADAPKQNGTHLPAGTGPAKEPEDPEKKAKKDAKAKLKAEKAAKAKQKEQERLAQAKAKEQGGGDSKKAKLKKEAEAKKAAEDEEVAKQLEAVRAIPKGQKKDYGAEMLKGYDPKYVEAATYAWWEHCGFFKPVEAKGAEKFVMVIPPPNVTGTLHLGHTLMVAIEDTLARWHRMSGRTVLWVPGMDHAGIATQTVVEKQLQRGGVSRHDLGREKFVDEVHKWVDDKGGKILQQLRRLGASPDWSRQAYTMSPQLSNAVLEAFLRMHKAGLIYRDNRLVNWDTRLQSAVSDIEVEYVDVKEYDRIKVPGYEAEVEFGVLTSFAYKLEEGEEEVVVATTRPETMLGDTAVAVHPEDERYAHLHGKHVVHPLDGRKIPIITDAELVDMSFGTGAVKITPAHDPNDFATGKRHNLQFLNILTNEGNINAAGGQFAGQPRFKARVTVVDWLKEKGLFRGTAGNAMRLGLCSRSGDVIEPVLKPQWWVDMKDMAAEAIAAAKDKRLTIIPSEFEATWFRWLEGIRDWCISRQLWWGHRVPAWYVCLEGDVDSVAGTMSEHLDRWVVASDAEAAQKIAEEKFPGKVKGLSQDEDVLDTWFSSSLFPFSTLGWPQETEDLVKYYPTTLLETGHDILFFWVAKMVMMGMKLTGEVPFSHVYLHSMVRDAHGRKMSKSLGNVIDPLQVIEGISLKDLQATLEGGNLDPREVEKAKAIQKEDFPEGIEECGTDALRLALISYTSQANSVNLDIKRVVAYRHWCNKLWNAVRFALMNLGDGFQPSAHPPSPASLPIACRWILSRLNAATEATVTAFETYAFSSASQALYSWFQYELCDVFIELVKPVITRSSSEEGADADKQAFRETLWICLDTGLRLLHPIMPFVTEELWQKLPKHPSMESRESIMICSYPAADPARKSAEVEADMEYVSTIVAKTRSIRTDYDLQQKQRPRLHILCKDAERRARLSKLTGLIGTLAFSDDVEVSGDAQAPSGCAVNVVDDTTSVCLMLKGVLDPVKEAAKLKDKQVKLERELQALQANMEMAVYKERTPQAIKAEDASKLARLRAQQQALQQALQSMEDMQKL